MAVRKSLELMEGGVSDHGLTDRKARPAIKERCISYVEFVDRKPDRREYKHSRYKSTVETTSR